MYQNPYLFAGSQMAMNPYQGMAPAAPQMQVTKVNGRNGAMQFQMGPNSSAWLLDETGTISWLCITDGAGYKTVTAYDISPHQDTPAVDVGSLEQRIQRLEEIVNGNATRNTNATRKGKPNDDAD